MGQTDFNPLMDSKKEKRCLLKSCGKSFVAAKSNQKFCSNDHQKEYHQEAYRIGEKVINSRGMHHAKQLTPRLYRVLDALSYEKFMSTFDLNLNARVTSSGTAIAELRRLGYQIEGRMRHDRAYEYKLTDNGGGDEHKGL